MNKFQLLNDGLFVNKISKTYGNKKVVRDISLSIQRGEIVGLLGPNGAGKTSTFYMIVGLVKPDSGSIILDKIDITKTPIYSRGTKGIGYLPQEPSIFQGITVYENLKGLAELSLQNQNDIKEFIENSIEEFGLSEISSSRSKILPSSEFISPAMI